MTHTASNPNVTLLALASQKYHLPLNGKLGTTVACDSLTFSLMFARLGLPEPIVNPLVEQFIQNHISSVAQLEILLLLQTNPQQQWSPAGIGRELRIEPAGAQQQLAHLVASNLVRQVGPEEFVYSPATPELQAGATALAQAYLIRRVTVIGLIFAKPPSPPSSLRAFSDAFKLRKDPPNAPPR